MAIECLHWDLVSVSSENVVFNLREVASPHDYRCALSFRIGNGVLPNPRGNETFTHVP